MTQEEEKKSRSIYRKPTVIGGGHKASLFPQNLGQQVAFENVPNAKLQATLFREDVLSSVNLCSSQRTLLACQGHRPLYRAPQLESTPQNTGLSRADNIQGMKNFATKTDIWNIQQCFVHTSNNCWQVLELEISAQYSYISIKMQHYSTNCPGGGNFFLKNNIWRRRVGWWLCIMTGPAGSDVALLWARQPSPNYTGNL